MSKVNNKDTRTTPVSLLLNLNFTPCSSISIVNFEHVNADWVSAVKVLLPFSLYHFSNCSAISKELLTSYHVNVVLYLLCDVSFTLLEENVLAFPQIWIHLANQQI